MVKNIPPVIAGVGAQVHTDIHRPLLIFCPGLSPFHRREFALGVEPQQVVLGQAEAADGWFGL
jgi:hypothetical protein